MIARDELDRLHDDLYVLACAIDDVEADLAAGDRRTVQSLTEDLSHLLDSARPLPRSCPDAVAVTPGRRTRSAPLLTCRP